jgi:hypothetical protein
MGIRATTNENENENEPVWLGKEKENCLLRSARDGAVVNEKKRRRKKRVLPGIALHSTGHSGWAAVGKVDVAFGPTLPLSNKKEKKKKDH